MGSNTEPKAEVRGSRRLALYKAAIEAHGGSISSSRGRMGVRFRFVLQRFSIML